MQTLLMANTEEISFTVIAQKSQVEELKFIAAWEQRKQKEIIDEMFTTFISNWKSKNKGVKFPNK